jgi:hypothetical protein
MYCVWIKGGLMANDLGFFWCGLITDFLDRLSVRYLIASGKKKKPAAKPREKDQKPLDLIHLGDSRRVRHDAGRSSFFSSARCVIIGPTLLLRGIFCVGEVVNHAR